MSTEMNLGCTVFVSRCEKKVLRDDCVIYSVFKVSSSSWKAWSGSGYVHDAYPDVKIKHIQYELLTGFLYTRQRVGRELYNVGLYCFFELFIAEYAHEFNCKLVLMANFTSQLRAVAMMKGL